MKKLIISSFILCFFTLSLHAAEEFVFKASTGLLIASVANKIVLDSEGTGDSAAMEDYEGLGGGQFGLAIGTNRLEIGYIYQYYIAENTTSSSYYKGDISFDLGTLDAGIFLFESDLKEGLNILVGIGKGIATVRYDSDTDSTYYANTSSGGFSAYVSEYHFNVMAQYRLFPYLAANLQYMSQTMSFVGGDSFTNTTTGLNVSIGF